MTVTIKATEEEIAEIKKFVEELKQKRQKPQEPQEPKELDIKELEQEITDENQEEENYCDNCGWKLEGKPAKCPQCDIELDWEN